MHLSSEVQTIWSFLQRYIDEEVNTICLTLEEQDQTLTTKMNQIDWVARNAEFLSPEAINKSIQAYKDLSLQPNYTKQQHSSKAVVTSIHLLRHFMLLKRDEQTLARISIILGLLEPLLVNDQNLDLCLQPSLNCMSILCEIVKLASHLKRKQVEVDDGRGHQLQVPLYVKYGMRCLASITRNSNGVKAFLFQESGLGHIFELLEYVRDEET